MTPYNGSQNVSRVVSTSCRTSDFFGKKSLVGAEGYTGSDSRDPAEQIKYALWAGRMSGNNAGLVRFRAYITMEYDAVFTEPKILIAS